MKKAKIEKSRLYGLLCIFMLVAVMVINVGITYAWFTDSAEATSQTLKFGTITLDINKDGVFKDETVNIVNKLKPGDSFLNETISVAKSSTSSAMYIRIKYVVSTESSNADIQALVINMQNITKSSSSSYKWSDKTSGGYYYLVNASGNPIIVDTTTSYTFITQANAIIPTNTEYDPLSITEADAITISLSIEAIQVENLSFSGISELEAEMNSAIL